MDAVSAAVARTAECCETLRNNFVSQFSADHRAYRASNRSGVEDLPRIQESAWIEEVLQPALQRDQLRGLFQREKAALGEAHAVLAGDRPPRLDRDAHHAGDGVIDGRALMGFVEEHVGVQVPVACMSIRRDGEAEL